jgi:hypothetical protein
MLDVMNKKAKGVSAWVALAALLLFAVAVGQGQSAQTEKKSVATADLMTVTLSMEWARGDPHYGPNFILLSTPCQASVDVPCECTMQFKTINSQEFADYISSFGDGLVPVVYQVSYGSDSLVRGTRLESVGTWRADRFHVNDRLLGTRYTFKGGKPGQKQPAKVHAPADCFPPKGN